MRISGINGRCHSADLPPLSKPTSCVAQNAKLQHQYSLSDSVL